MKVSRLGEQIAGDAKGDAPGQRRAEPSGSGVLELCRLVDLLVGEGSNRLSRRGDYCMGASVWRGGESERASEGDLKWEVVVIPCSGGVIKRRKEGEADELGCVEQRAGGKMRSREWSSGYIRGEKQTRGRRWSVVALGCWVLRCFDVAKGLGILAANRTARESIQKLQKQWRKTTTGSRAFSRPGANCKDGQGQPNISAWFQRFWGGDLWCVFA